MEIRLMYYDASRVVYLSEKAAKKQSIKNKARRVDNPLELLADTGLPVFNGEEEK